MSLPRSDRRALLRGGFYPLLSRVGRRLCSPLFSWESLHFFERDLTQAIASEVPARPDIEVRLATTDEMLAFLSPRPGEAAQRIAAGDLCFVGLLRGRIVHQTWLGTRATYIPELGARIRLGESETYIYASLTEEDSRGSGVQAAVAGFIVRYQKEHAFRRHMLVVKWHNFSGRKVLSRIQPPPRALRTVRRMRFLRLRGWWVRDVPLAGDPLFDVDAASVRSLGALGYWLFDRDRSS